MPCKVMSIGEFAVSRMFRSAITVSPAVPSVSVDDDVILIGRDGMHAVTADDMAATIGTINYEVVTRINPLLPRVIC